MNQIDQIFQKSSNPSEFSRSYCEYLGEVLKKLDYTAIGKFIDLLLRARAEGQQIFFIGNGGSAATSSHFSNDIQIGTRATNPPFKAISLTDNVAILTAIGNDDGYENIFKLQLEKLMNDGDVVVAISASGNSPSIITAVEYAKNRQSTIVGLTGFDGGKLKPLSDINIHVETKKGEYGPVEDVHMVIDHLVGSFLLRQVNKL